MSLLELAGGMLVLAGGAFWVLAAAGLLRMPDFFTRVHAAGLGDTLGAGAILLGLALHSGLSLATVKLALLAALLAFSSPTATHALARAALARGLAPRLAEPEEAPSSR